MPPKRELPTPRCPDAEHEPPTVLHPSFDQAKNVGGLRVGINAVSMVVALATVMFALSWPPLTCKLCPAAGLLALRFCCHKFHALSFTENLQGGCGRCLRGNLGGHWERS